MKTIYLDGLWNFHAVDAYKTLPKSQRAVTKWMEGTVPGTIHTDLLDNKKIPDPYYRMNELDVQWVETQQWLYRKEITLPAEITAETNIDLLAEGLDTYARISINGKLVGETADMFVEHRLPVKKYLKTGKNVIEILFDSPTVRSKQLEDKHGVLNVALQPQRVYVRKAQYSFSWDWGPKLTTSGIWRTISLEAYSHPRLKDPFVRVVSVQKDKARIEVSVELDREKKGMMLHAHIGGPSSSIEKEVTVAGTMVRMEVDIPKPELWWPNGYGAQPMYGVVLTLTESTATLDQAEATFAIRTVRLVREKDEDGESFIVEINGKQIYCKGADWIPSDNFIPRITDDTYETLLHRAKEAHMNMIRVWGGGIYEQDVFYTLCDQLGLMVWQDFMFACGEYPDQAWFYQQVRDEAEKAIKRLRNHPSIVVWCGNNECEWLYCTEHPGASPDEMSGANIFSTLLPSLCNKFDGTRPYWRSSPFGSGFPNDESNGNHHQWMVWSFWKDYKEYENVNARFVTEYGFQAPANVRTFEEVTLPEDRDPQSKVMEHHNKQVEGPERLFRFQAAHYGVDTSFEGFIYQGQLVQAEALKLATEHWRRRKFRTAGSLFWQLNDCWPVSSWAVIDSALRPKAGYFYSKKFYAPVLLSFKKIPEGVEVWIVNDLLEKVSGKVALVLQSFDGKQRWRKSVSATIASNSSQKVFLIPSKVLESVDPDSHYVIGEFFRGSECLSENRFYFEEPKHLAFREGFVDAQILDHSDGGRSIVFHADTLAKNVFMEFDGVDVEVSDNFFDLDPGRVKEITLGSDLTTKQLTKKMKLRWL